jgi:glutamate 5-kinase
VGVVDAEGTEFARGLTSYPASDVRRIQGMRSSDIEATLGYKYIDEVIRRDDLVIL